MTMTTIQIGSGQLATRWAATGSVDRHATASIARLVALAAAVAILGGAAAAVAVGVLVATLSGTPAAAGQVAALGLTFIPITVPLTGIWLVGAIQTSRTI